MPERISLEIVQEILKKLEENGIKVLVTIGNHDINNGDARNIIDKCYLCLSEIQWSYEKRTFPHSRSK